ncbi:hypothetical protein J2T07_001290 [Luteibacter jiangsuensis]|uniref:Uncharacterized protein n=1 Tax=Luteibacter jiangsuensis TaxID=637577 RepID=A0ABT9SXS5_9GAMM|nr:hypothetical protein [Luteibacter jiangsuensis]MDQ0009113.1 hypothetical protein [Luteibacter jiangsuensis]
MTRKPIWSPLRRLEVKLGILLGSLTAGVAGWLVFLGGQRKNVEDGTPSIAAVP